MSGIAHRRLALVVDPSARSGRRVKMALAEVGYQVLSATRPDEGLALARRGVVQLVFLEVNLGRTRGVELLPKFLADSDPPPPTVVMLTGDHSLRSRFESLWAGAVDYVVKQEPGAEYRERLRRAASLTGCRWEPLAADEQCRELLFELELQRQLRSTGVLALERKGAEAMIGLRDGQVTATEFAASRDDHALHAVARLTGWRFEFQAREWTKLGGPGALKGDLPSPLAELTTSYEDQMSPEEAVYGKTDDLSARPGVAPLDDTVTERAPENLRLPAPSAPLPTPPGDALKALNSPVDSWPDLEPEPALAGSSVDPDEPTHH